MVAADKPAVNAKPLFDTNMVETVRAMDVFPIPPGPMRAVGVVFSARPTILSTNSPHPKQALSGLVRFWAPARMRLVVTAWVSLGVTGWKL